MKLEFTADELNRYFKGQVKHPLYDDTLEQSKYLTIHAEGDFPDDLIKERRPSEIEKIRDYRQKIFESITYPVMSKVITSIKKIRRSPDWMVKFDESKFSKRIPIDQTPKDYLTENYPNFGSLENWLYDLCLQNYIVDANAVVAVIPIKPDVAVNEFLQPYTYLFKSEQVIDFVDGDYAVLAKDEAVTILDEKGNTKQGKGWFILTTLDVAYYESTKDGSKSWLRWTYTHDIGELPAFKVRGVVKRTQGTYILFKSRIDAMKPRLNEAIREYNDLAVEVVQNIYSERWEFGTDDCKVCNGSGETKGKGFLSTSKEKCGHCDGSGLEPRGPFSVLKVKPPMPGENALPTPPAGFIEKNIEIVRIQDERVDKHIYHALAAINMEFLAEKPLNESGVAKAYDKDEINNFIHSIAVDLVNIYLKSAYFIIEMRYRSVVEDKKARWEHLPMVSVPERFDLLSAQYYEEEITRAKKNGINPAIIAEMERHYVTKRFAGDDLAKSRMLAVLELDPLTGLSEEDKIMRVQNSGITRADYFISSNIAKLVTMAERTDVNFLKKTREEQYNVIQQMATKMQPDVARVVIPEDV